MLTLLKFKQKRSLMLIATAILLCAAQASYAQDAENTPTDILPKVTYQSDYDAGAKQQMVKLTPDKSEILRLDRAAGSIIIGNPVHLSILADSPTTLVLVPRLPGATHFTILDKRGEVIMARHAIVASPKEDYVRVKRVCREDSDGCTDTSVFFCPDTCHEIGIIGQDSTDGGDSSNDQGDDDTEGSDDSATEEDSATE